MRLPFKPTLRFILTYFLRLGFLDGRAGYTYARLLSQYEFQIGVKLFELQQMGGSLNNAKTVQANQAAKVSTSGKTVTAA